MHLYFIYHYDNSQKLLIFLRKLEKIILTGLISEFHYLITIFMFNTLTVCYKITILIKVFYKYSVIIKEPKDNGKFK